VLVRLTVWCRATTATRAPRTPARWACACTRFVRPAAPAPTTTPAMSPRRANAPTATSPSTRARPATPTTSPYIWTEARWPRIPTTVGATGAAARIVWPLTPRRFTGAREDACGNVPPSFDAGSARNETAAVTAAIGTCLPGPADAGCAGSRCGRQPSPRRGSDYHETGTPERLLTSTWA